MFWPNPNSKDKAANLFAEKLNPKKANFISLFGIAT
jgi:hypothetical protein